VVAPLQLLGHSNTPIVDLPCIILRRRQKWHLFTISQTSVIRIHLTSLVNTIICQHNNLPICAIRRVGQHTLICCLICSSSIAAQWLKIHGPIAYNGTIETIDTVRPNCRHRREHDKQQSLKTALQIKKETKQENVKYFFISDSFQNFSTIVKAISYNFSFIRISIRDSIDWLSAVTQKQISVLILKDC
jgi:transcription elongation factor Elf1